MCFWPVWRCGFVTNGAKAAYIDKESRSDRLRNRLADRGAHTLHPASNYPLGKSGPLLVYCVHCHKCNVPQLDNRRRRPPLRHPSDQTLDSFRFQHSHLSFIRWCIQPLRDWSCKLSDCEIKISQFWFHLICFPKISDWLRFGKPETHYNRYVSLQTALYAGPVFAVLSFAGYLFAALYVEEDKKKVELIIKSKP